MAEILADCGPDNRARPGDPRQDNFGLQSAYVKRAGQEPVRFVGPGQLLTNLDDDDLVIVRLSRTDHSTMAGPLPVALLSLA